MLSYLVARVLVQNMSTNKLSEELEKGLTFKRLIIDLEQEKGATLPYHGPIVRGWLGSHLFREQRLFQSMFKNPLVDVKPYFFHTEVVENKRGIPCIVRSYINLVGTTENLHSKIVNSVMKSPHTHLGGIEARIIGVRLDDVPLVKKNLAPGFIMSLDTPLSLMENGELLPMPSFGSVIRATVRTINKFTKHHWPELYPYHVDKSIYDTPATITTFNLTPFAWKHRNMRGRLIDLTGQMGHVGYQLDSPDEKDPAVDELVTMLDLVQIGRNSAYGFGHITFKNLQQMGT